MNIASALQAINDHVQGAQRPSRTVRTDGFIFTRHPDGTLHISYWWCLVNLTGVDIVPVGDHYAIRWTGSDDVTMASDTKAVWQALSDFRLRAAHAREDKMIAERWED